MTPAVFTDKEQRKFLNRHLRPARKGTLDYGQLTRDMNKQFRTHYTVYQVSGFIGRRLQILG